MNLHMCACRVVSKTEAECLFTVCEFSHMGMSYLPSPGLLDAIFSDSLGVLKRTGWLGGLLPPMLMLWTWTMYSVSSSRSQSAQERVVVFTSWMNLSMRTSFFCRWEGKQKVRNQHQQAKCNVILHWSLLGNSFLFWQHLSRELTGQG